MKKLLFIIVTALLVNPVISNSSEYPGVYVERQFQIIGNIVESAVADTTMDELQRKGVVDIGNYVLPWSSSAKIVEKLKVEEVLAALPDDDPETENGTCCKSDKASDLNVRAGVVDKLKGVEVFAALPDGDPETENGTCCKSDKASDSNSSAEDKKQIGVKA